MMYNLKSIMGRIFNPKPTEINRKSLRSNMTEAEIILWSQLKGNSHGAKFRRQFGIMSFILDFYCSEYKLAIEVDGSIHETKKQTAIDIERQRLIESRKITFLRFTNEQIKYDLSKVLDIIDETIYQKKSSAKKLTPPVLRTTSPRFQGRKEIQQQKSLLPLKQGELAYTAWYTAEG